MLTAVWHMLTDYVDYHDLGGDYFTRLDPERAMRRIVRQANALGFTVRFDPYPSRLRAGRERTPSASPRAPEPAPAQP